MNGQRILIIATGAANVMRLPELLGTIRAGLRDQVAPNSLTMNLMLSRGAEALTRPETAGLFVDTLYAESDPAVHFKPGHMGLALEHDLVVVLPASAQTIAACAHGLSHRLAAEVILGHPNPALFFPSMNRHMWAAPPTQRNIAQLEHDGHHVIRPQLVPGLEAATGQKVANPGLPPTRDIIEHLAKHLSPAPQSTGGPIPVSS